MPKEQSREDEKEALIKKLVRIITAEQVADYIIEREASLRERVAEKHQEAEKLMAENHSLSKEIIALERRIADATAELKNYIDWKEKNIQATHSIQAWTYADGAIVDAIKTLTNQHPEQK